MLEGLDPTSPTWRVIEKWANERLTALRLRNDGLTLDERETAKLRGEIAATKLLLTLAKASPSGSEFAGDHPPSY